MSPNASGLLQSWRHPPDGNWTGNRGAKRRLSNGPSAEAQARLIRLERFWEPLPASQLRTVFGRLMAAAASSGAGSVVVEQRSDGELVYAVGGTFTRSLLAGTLPGAELVDQQQPLRTAEYRVALAGLPGRLDRGVSSIVDVLAQGARGPWRLVLVFGPAPDHVLDAELAAATRLCSEVSTAARRHDREAARHSRDVVDIAAQRLAEQLSRYAERVTAMRAGVGIVTECWIEADDPGEARRSARLALAAITPAEMRPIRVFDAGGQEPATTLLTPDEVAALVAPPTVDLPGLRSTARVPFDAFVEPHDLAGGHTVLLGENHRRAELRYPVDAMTSHGVITGQSGAGKTSLVVSLLDQVADDVGVLVLEPSKQEYARVLGGDYTVIPFGSPALADGGLMLNPFAFPYSRVPIQTHIDHLVALFEASFDLISPLPQLLASAIPMAYQNRGWDLVSSRHVELDRNPAAAAFPTLSEVIDATQRLIAERGYTGEVRSNVLAALDARLGALTVGAKGRVFDRDVGCDALDLAFAGRSVVNLDLVGSDREKSFLCGLLLVRMWETRRGGQCDRLRHLLVIEEAHHVLGASRQGAAGTSDGAGEWAAQLAADALAEFRAAGQGLLVIEQSPARLVREVMVNTSLKVALRSTEGEDKTVLAAALALDDHQRDELTGLRRFQGLVLWDGMDAPHRVELEHAPVRSDAPPLPVAGSAAGIDALWAVPAVRAAALVVLGCADHDVGRLSEAIARSGRDSVPQDILGRLLDRAVDHVGASRRWPADLRTVSAHGGLVGVRARMLDGSQPFSGCESACPHGGCLARELAIVDAAMPHAANGPAERLDRVTVRCRTARHLDPRNCAPPLHRPSGGQSGI